MSHMTGADRIFEKTDTGDILYPGAQFLIQQSLTEPLIFANIGHFFLAVF